MKRMRVTKQIHSFLFFVFQLVIMLSEIIHANPTSTGLFTGWCDNSYGQSALPPKVAGENITKIATFGSHNLALKSDSSVVVWGRNEHGECNVPPGLEDVIAIAAGEDHCLALKSDGTIVVWGWNYNKIGNRFISDLEADQFGNIWVYTRDEEGWYRNDQYLWRYDGQVWHKYEGVHGPLALDPQKNLLAVDSLIKPGDGPVITSRFRIVSFNGTEFVCKWRSKVDQWMAEDYLALACIAQDSKGNPWISYYGDRYYTAFGVVCNKTLYTTLDGLADNNVRSITTDESGTVWFGTEGGGLLAYKDKTWHQFTTHDGIPHNSIRSCAVDSKDNLWILTDHGIAMRKSDGMVQNQTRCDFKNPGNKQDIIQRGNRFYVSSNKKPDIIR